MISGFAWAANKFPFSLDSKTASTRQAIFAQVENIDIRRHKELLEEEEIRQLIVETSRTIREIAIIPNWKGGLQVKRYLFWRLGELHYFLGARNLDYSEFDSMTRFWQEASVIRFQEQEVRRLQCQPRLKERIMNVADFRPFSGLGLAYMHRAFFREPLRHSVLALRSRRQSWSYFAAGHGIDLHALPDAVSGGSASLGMQLNELGHALAQKGYLSANVDTLNAGIHYLEEELQHFYLAFDRSARGSALHNLSESYYWRGCLRNSVDDIQLCIAMADSAMQVRTRAASLRPFATTERLKGRAYLELLRATGDWDSPVLSPLIAALEISSDELQEAGRHTHAALHRATLGRLLLGRAIAQRDTAQVRDAGRLIRAAYDSIPGDVMPHQRSLVAVDQAHALTGDYLADPNAPTRTRALELLHEAERLTVRSQHAPMHQEIQQLRQQLAVARATKPVSN